MFDLRDLKLLTALARHRHFGRAAEDMGTSQPAFSMRLRAMEERLGIAIVRRGNRFQGLTPEGEAFLARAREILEGVRALEDELRAAHGTISGPLTLGVIPTAAAYAARLVGRLHQHHPGVVVRIETASSLTIQSRIEDGIFDAGITYDEPFPDAIAAQPLYTESYVLVAPPGLVPHERGQITWAEAAALPLSLLDSSMQNRRILDQTFASVGAVPRVVSETNALTTALVQARDGIAATVIPATHVETLGAPPGTRVFDLVEPRLEKRIALVSAAREPVLITVGALKAVASGIPS